LANPQAQQSATLDAFLGLLTNVSPDSVPEGGSPLNWDVDYVTGSVGTRPGLVSHYHFCVGA
jgi:hypothetical protein